MSWFLVAILAYLILAVVFLIDKYLLVGPIPNPKVYTFFTGVFRILVLLLIPFISFSVPDKFQIVLALLSGGAFVLALYWFFKGLQLFEASRIVPAIGGILPIFSLFLIYIFSQGKEVLGIQDLSAFLLLILGSVLITYKRAKKISLKSLKYSITAALFFALSFVLAKYVYLAQPFLQGLIWINIGGFLMAASFLLMKEVRRELFKTKIQLPKKTAGIFISNQLMGAGANILQNWAIFLAPLVYVSVVNALQGVQYAFLLIFAVILSLKFPNILKEEVSKEVILQKVIAIILIGGGLWMIAL